MKKIIFLLIFFSFRPVFAFAPFVPYFSMTPAFESDEQFNSNYDAAYLNSFVGKYTDCFFQNRFSQIWFFSTKIASPFSKGATSCYILGWAPSLIVTSVTPVASGGIYFFDRTFLTFSPPSCPNSASSFYIMSKSDNYNSADHSICLSDCTIFNTDFCSCPSIYYGVNYRFYVCEIEKEPSSLFSEETAKKRNELLSQSNSNLGSIAGSNSAATELLKKIKDALLSLNSANFGIFGTNADSSDESNKNNPNSPEYEPTLSDSNINVSRISPSMSEIGSCPKDISISVMNSTHYLSYQPFCNFAERLRPLVIAAARVSAAWLVIGAL
ncbi:MAG: virulence factor TspB C-terminal domain-related protein [Methylococcales bacterium]|nr:virulence factor TspB C-terminal domain-related protein [Methylococcales bacterium]